MQRASVCTRLCLLAVILLGPPLAQAAVTEAWVQRYSAPGGDSVDQAFKVLRDPAGDFLVVGATADSFAVQGLLIIKYSGADGSVLWQRRYDGTAAILISSDPAASVLAAVVDASGNLVVTTRADGTNGDADYYTAKYAAADGSLLWERRYDGPWNGGDIPAAVAVDGSGNVVVTGYSGNGHDPYFNTDYPTDYYTAKYAAADGGLLWEKRYDGPTRGWDFATAVAVDASGNVVVTGGSYNEIDNNGLPYDSDYYTAKYAAADGALLWDKRYSGQAGGDDIAQAVAVDASGNVVVTGYSYGLSSYYDYYTVKYAAADGAFLWEKRYDGPAHNLDVPTALVVDSGGNVVVTGYSYSNNFYYNYYTAKYAATNGALLWERRYNGPVNYYDEPTALAVDASGNVVVTGFSYGLSSSFDYYTAKYAAADGALLWEKRYNGPTNGDDIAKGVAVDASGNVVVTGYANYDFYTAKYAAVNGALLWERGYSGPYNLDDQALAVAVDGVGNVVVTGYSVRSASASDYDYYTAKYAATDGALLWERRYNGPANGDDIPVALAADASGNVLVTGNSAGTGAYTAKYAAGDGALLWEKLSSFVAADMALDASGNVLVTGRASGYYTAKYAAANGALLWERRGGNGEPDGSSLAVDANGNVVVSGSFFDGITFYYNSYTAKYAAADGAILWERSNNGSEDYYLLAQAAAVDAGGNVLVAGLSGSGGDFYTAKYAAATGALLWEKSYNGPVDGEDFAQAVAVDASGNVVVTGYSDGATDGLNFYRDYYTAKYAAANGALLWERRYNGPANGNDSAKAVAVDASGNVVVTGTSVGNTNSTARDYYTAAYAAADGALLWEKRYNGPANGDDFVVGPHSLALGPNGMVAITGASDGAFGPFFSVFDYATVVYREALPSVSIARSNAFVIVSWPVTGLNFQLQETTDLSLPNSWSPVAQAAVTNAAQVSVTVPTTVGRKFFRLKSQ